MSGRVAECPLSKNDPPNDRHGVRPKWEVMPTPKKGRATSPFYHARIRGVAKTVTCDFGICHV